MNTKQFTGFLSSVENPGTLALSLKGFGAFIISLAVLWASLHGLDAATVTSQLQSLINNAITTVSAFATAISLLVTFYGLARKVFYELFAKPVATVQVPVEVPQPIAPATIPTV
jgi:hypothetical protein